MGTSGCGQSRERHPGGHDGDACTAPPPGHTRAHTAKLIRGVTAAAPRSGSSRLRDGEFDRVLGSAELAVKNKHVMAITTVPPRP